MALCELVGLCGTHAPLLAGRGADHAEPDDALAGGLLLERLHIAGLVMLAHVGALMIGPLENHDLASVAAKADALSGAGQSGERRGGFAHLGGGPGEPRHGDAAGEGGEPGSDEECAPGRILRHGTLLSGVTRR